MENARLTVTRRVARWGIVYKIGGTEGDGEILPTEQADDLIARFNFEQSLLASNAALTIESQPTMPNLRVVVHAVSL